MDSPIDMTSLRWFKSSHSGGGGCVEVAFIPGGDGVALRDTKDHGTKEPLMFNRGEWRAFLAGAQNGEFNLPA